MIVVAIDPALANTGIAVISDTAHRGLDVLDHQTITTKPSETMPVRLHVIWSAITAFLWKWEGQQVVIEIADRRLFHQRSDGGRNMGALVVMGQAQGVALGAVMARLAINRIHMVTTREWKGQRTKRDEAFLARMQFPGDKLRNEHERDAGRLAAWWLARQGALTW